MARFGLADYAVIVAFILCLLYVGFGARRRLGGMLGFLVAGRSVTLPALVATLVVSWYGGILGTGEYTYTYGISNWFVNGVPYYAFAILFGCLIAPHIREAEVFSLSDRLAQTYGNAAAVIGAVLTFILTTPAPYLLMIGILIARLVGWNATGLHLFWACVLGGVISTVYLYTGGLKADIRGNIVQFLAMYIGVAMIIPFALVKYGGLSFLQSRLPSGHWTWDGGMGAWYIISWFFIGLWTMVDPGFHQRCAAAKEPRTARNALLWSVVLWFIFDVITTTVGLYSRAILGEAVKGNATDALPALADTVLGPGFRGMFYVGMVACITSALVSCAFLGGVAFGRDIVWRAKRAASDERVTVYTRWGIVVATAVGLVLALTVKSVVALWYDVGSCMIPGLLLPVVLSFFPRWRPARGSARAMLLLGAGASTGWFVHGVMHSTAEGPQYLWGCAPMYPGLVVTVIIYVCDRMAAGIRQRPAEVGV